MIDECQNYFAKEDKVLTWWLTYHGHLHQDIILITQNFDLLEKSYFKLAEFYYRAVPPSARLFSSKFRYIQYNSYKLFKTEKIGDFHVPMIQDIFSMYVSGASNNTKSVVKRYFLYFAILMVVVVLLLMNFLSQFDTSKNLDKNATASTDKNASLVASTPPPAYDLPQHKQKSDKTQKVECDNSSDELFEIRCIDMLCNYKGTDFPLPLFNKLTAKLSPDFVWFFKNSAYTQYFVMLPSDTFDFLQIEEKKDKKDAVQNSTPKMPSAVMASHK